MFIYKKFVIPERFTEKKINTVTDDSDYIYLNYEDLESIRLSKDKLELVRAIKPSDFKQYYLIPQKILDNRDLSHSSKILYFEIVKMITLSINNTRDELIDYNFCDEIGYYTTKSVDDFADSIGVGNKKIKRLLKELEPYLIRRKVSFYGNCRTYLREI